MWLSLAVYLKSAYLYYIHKMEEINSCTPDKEVESKLWVNRRIIALDGVDGSGKSTLAEMLVERLNEDQGEKAVLVKFNFEGGGEGEERIKRILETKKPSEKITSGLVAAGINRAYGEQIIPALKDNKLVVLDRSEIDLLRFAFEQNNQTLCDKRFKYISKGILTHGLWAGNRVFVEMDAKDIWKNLIKRKNKSKYDPNNLDEIKKRIRAQLEVEKMIDDIKCSGNVNKIRVTNRYAMDYREHLDGLVRDIRGQLKL